MSAARAFAVENKSKPISSPQFASRWLSAKLSSGADVKVRIRLQNVEVLLSDDDVEDEFEVDAGEGFATDGRNKSRKGGDSRFSASHTGLESSKNLEAEGTLAVKNVKSHSKEDFDRSFSESTSTSLDISQEAALNPEKHEMEANSSHGGSEDDDRAAHSHTRRGRSSSFDLREFEGGGGATRSSYRGAEDSGFNSRESSASSTQANGPGASSSIAADAFNYADASLLLGIAGGQSKQKETSTPATIPNTMTSFLDMLSDEQRRVRHRHIPAVEGIRKLYKSEIKQDLASARASNGKRGGKGRRNSGIGNEDTIGVYGDDTVDVHGEDESASDNETLSELAASGGKKGTGTDTKIGKSFGAFVAPPDNSKIFANISRLTTLIESSQFEKSSRLSSLRSPQLVESLTAFNPPRPQESIGSKTKHRMKRWESNPEDVEVDLMNYRKTVQRTRIELHNAEDEHAHIESVASAIRLNFMNHLIALHEENIVLNNQVQYTQSECFKIAESLNPKVGAKSSKSMKDVLLTLMSLNEEFRSRGIFESSLMSKRASFKDWRGPGIGGISSQSIGERVGSKEIEVLSQGWFLRGDNVVTPLGEGKVIHVFGPGPQTQIEKASHKTKVNSQRNPAGKMTKVPSIVAKGLPRARIEESLSPNDSLNSTQTNILFDRVGVLLSSGEVKYFSPPDVSFKQLSFCPTDRELADRWESITKTALEAGVGHDYLGMDRYYNMLLLKQATDEPKKDAEGDENDESSRAHSSIDPKGGRPDDKQSGETQKPLMSHDDICWLLPYGAEFLRSTEIIKNFPSLIPVDVLEDTARKTIFHKKAGGYQALVGTVRKFEAQREELNQLRGKVMQLRNRLSRQKRLRNLNERSLIAGQNHSRKIEGLLLEMQMDLKNLKERLQDELVELGIGISGAPSAFEYDKGKSLSNDSNIVLSTDQDAVRAPKNSTSLISEGLVMESKRESLDNGMSPSALTYNSMDI